jgi:hypothetical protein
MARSRKTLPEATQHTTESALVCDLIDELVRDVECGSPLTAPIYFRWSKFRKLDEQTRMQDPDAKPPFFHLRRLWIVLALLFVNNWRKHYLETTAEVTVLAEWMSRRLVDELGAGWLPEEEDLRELVYHRWFLLIQAQLQRWVLLVQAEGGRLYDFEDEV